MYEYTLPSPVMVEVGDVVLVHYQQSPQNDRNFLQLAFKTNTTDSVSYQSMRPVTSLFQYSTNRMIVGQERDTLYIPLVTPLMCKLKVFYFSNPIYNVHGTMILEAFLYVELLMTCVYDLYPSVLSKLVLSVN